MTNWVSLRRLAGRGLAGAVLLTSFVLCILLDAPAAEAQPGRAEKQRIQSREDDSTREAPTRTNGAASPHYERDLRMSLTEPVYGRVLARAPESDAVLYQVFGRVPNDLIGWSLFEVPDTDGDGVRDIVISAPNAHLPGGLVGEVSLHSGADGAELWRARSLTSEVFGIGLGDPARAGLGRTERAVVVRTYWSDPVLGEAYGWQLLDLETGNVIDVGTEQELAADIDWHVPAEQPPSFAAEPIRDLNGDGLVDITDLNILMALIGSDAGGPPPGDLNADGAIGAEDVALLLERFGADLGLQGQLGCWPECCMCWMPGCGHGCGPGDPGIEDMTNPPPGTPPACRGDADQDGLANWKDCDSDCYIGNTEFDCGCRDDDGDGDWNQNEECNPCDDPTEAEGGPVDLDLDSDNDNGNGHPSRTKAEEAWEEVEGHYGALIEANTDNDDSDFYVDFADGYNLDNIAGNDDDINKEDVFTPIVIDLEFCGAAENITFSLVYSASDPMQVEGIGANLIPGEGSLRIWTLPANHARSGYSLLDPISPGHFVPSGGYTAADLGIPDNGGAVTLYLEAVAIEGGLDISIQSGSENHDTVTVSAYELEVLGYDESNGPTIGSLMPVQDLRPSVSITLLDARLNSNAEIEVTVEGRVFDLLSEITPDPTHRLQRLDFFVNGVVVEAIHDLPELSGEGLDDLWRPYALDLSFERTLIIPPGPNGMHAAGYVLEARTSANGAGHYGSDHCLVSIQHQSVSEIFPGLREPVPGLLYGSEGLVLEYGVPTPNPTAFGAMIRTISDEEGLCGGSVVPVPGEPSVLEGVLAYGEHCIPADIRIEFEGAPEFTAAEVDTFTAILTHIDPLGHEYSLLTRWVETTPDSWEFHQVVADGLSLAFENDPSPIEVDEVRAYFGDRLPVISDPQLAEELAAPDSLVFRGVIIAPDGQTQVDAVITLSGVGPWSAASIDSFTGVAECVLGNGGTVRFEHEWAETTPDSRVFRPTSLPLPVGAVLVSDDPTGGDVLFPVIVAAGDDAYELESSNESMERLTIRTVGIPPEAAEILSIEFEGAEFALAPLPPTQQGTGPGARGVLYWIDPNPTGYPKLLVLTQDALPAGVDWPLPEDFFIGGGDIVALHGFLHAHGLPKGTPVLPVPMEADYGAASAPGEPPTPQDLTLQVLLTWFGALYGDVGTQLLGFYLYGGNEVLLEDTCLVCGDLQTSVSGDPAVCKIKIDPDVDPITGAQLLYEGLRKSVGKPPFIDNLPPGVGGDVLDAIILHYEARFAEMAGVVSAGTRLYLAGIGIANEGVDWVLTIDDLSEGHWVAAVGFLPFVSAAAVPGAKMVIQKTDGTPLASFTKAGADAATAAFKKLTFAERWNALQAGNLPTAARYALVHGGELKVGRRQKLREFFKANVPLPDGYTLDTLDCHHELPWAFREHFAAYGFDVNDPQFGKWVAKGPHGRWSQGANGWNTAWTKGWDGDGIDVIGKLKETSTTLKEGRDLVLTRLNQLRGEYGVDGDFPALLPGS